MTNTLDTTKASSTLKAGDWVEVRSKEEILATLDESGKLDGMPFMPEMLEWCGRSLQVYKRAHKTCDTVFPIRGRRVSEAVHLETRCDGKAHGGCQAGCLLFWKEAWLKPVSGKGEFPSQAGRQSPERSAGCTEEELTASTQLPSLAGEPVAYSCQATQLPYFTTDLQPGDISQYVEDYRSGNVGLWRIFSGWVYSMYFNLSQAGIGLGPVMRWFYDSFHWVWRGPRFPRHSGSLPVGEPTPAASLNLQPGEWVRVKSYEEILKTLNTKNMNRGMIWDAELVPYCGGTYRVLRRVDKILDEKTGNMAVMKTPCIILDDVACEARYSACRMFCPRGIYPYWREIWLERVEAKSGFASEQLTAAISKKGANEKSNKDLVQIGR